MGSRTIVIVCRDELAALQRFGVVDEGIGICYTCTWRRFFNTPALETELLARLSVALETAGFWEEFNTSWVCLDCELMPWSAKATELLRQQYAAVGAGSLGALSSSLSVLQQAVERGIDVSATLNQYQKRSRGLSGKRSLALREFALGIEALERFVAKEPLRRIHECVFGILAVESEPVDPRL